LENVSAWISADGSERHYFNGDGSYGDVCSCYSDVDDSCHKKPWFKKCHCDVYFNSVKTSDEGYLTNATHLPVVGFQYGFLTGQANVTIGKLECSGQKVVDDGSCNAIKMSGATRTGYYLTGPENETNRLKVVHCNMNLPFFDARMERDAGFVQISAPAKFVVQQDNDLSWANQNAIPYSKLVNCDGGWRCDLTNGIFTVPKTASYVFVVSGTAGKADSTISINKQTFGMPPVKLEDMKETSRGKYSLTELSNRY